MLADFAFYYYQIPNRTLKISQKNCKISADITILFRTIWQISTPAQIVGNVLIVGNLNFWRGPKFLSPKIRPPKIPPPPPPPLQNDKAINNRLAYSVLFLSKTGLFPARRNFWSVSCSNVFLSTGNNPRVFKNSTEHAEPLFIMFRQFP